MTAASQERTPVTHQAEPGRSQRPTRSSRMTIGLIMLAVAGVGLAALAASGHSSEKAVLRLSAATAHLQIWTVPVATTCSWLAGSTIAAAVLAWFVHQRVARAALLAAGIGAVVFAVIVWSAGGSTASLADLLQSTVQRSLPLLLGAFAGVISERAGVVNVAIEGQMLAGAWAGALFATVTSSLVIGLLCSAIGGAVVAALLAVLAIRYLVDQAVAGIVLNILILGITSFLINGVMTTDQNGLNNPPVMPVLSVPGLSQLPVIGAALFSGTVLLYVAYSLLAALHFSMFKTRWGLRLRSVGENPRAAHSLGINVKRARYRALLLGGLIAGLGGAYLTIGSVGAFGDNITSGQGFIALAAVILGRWRPLGAAGAALLFGFAEALQSLLATLNTPVSSQLLLMAPYVVTLVVVAGFLGHTRSPEAAGKPFTA